MKTISVSVDDETHRLARIRAAETGTTVSAMMRDLLTALLQRWSRSRPRPSPRGAPGSWMRCWGGSGGKG